jgi:hypothetical protein
MVRMVKAVNVVRMRSLRIKHLSAQQAVSHVCGRSAMLPESIPVLKEKAAEQFEKYDAKPLRVEEVRSLEEADRFFKRHKPR